MAHTRAPRSEAAETGPLVRELDCSRALSDAMCEVIVAHHRGAPFDLARTMVLVPGGRLAHAIERRLLAQAAQAGAPLIAPTIVTPLMFAGRFVEPALPVVSALASRLAWREAIDRAIDGGDDFSRAVAELFRNRPELPQPARARAAERMARLSSEIAAAMLSFDDVADACAGDASLAARWRTIVGLAARRSELLAKAGCADRDDAIRDAVRDGRISSELHDRIVVLFADPEPAQRALLALLARRGCTVEVCVHTREDVGADGFPLLDRWEARDFPEARLASSSIRVADGPEESADAVIEIVRALPAPRRTDEIAVMVADDELQRAVERALEIESTPAAGAESRGFAASRTGTLLARLSALVGERDMDSFAAFIRHPDAERFLGTLGLEQSVAEYRAATVATRWDDAVVKSGAYCERSFGELQQRVSAIAEGLSGDRAASEWARPLRKAVGAIIGENHDGAFVGERLRSVHALDRALRDLSEVPPAMCPRIGAQEAIDALLSTLARESLRDDCVRDGFSLLRWLDAGIADEKHLVLAGLVDGLVPEGAVADPLLPDQIRRRLGMPSSLRRCARDAWILDGILVRTAARDGATISCVVPRRAADGEPHRPSRFLLRVGRSELPARVLGLFPKSADPPEPSASGAQAAAAFAIKPALAPFTCTAISVTAFRAYMECPYLFQLRNDPRLRLRAEDEFVRELAPNAFGTLLHEAAESWAREEIARGTRTEDAAVIEAELSRHLDDVVHGRFPESCAPAVRIQIELVRRRLRRLAELQAEQAKAGWRIRAVELSFAEKAAAGKFAAPLFPGSDGLFLTGRIDRIDRHDGTGEWRALDYKTGVDADSPTAAHRAGKRDKNGAWNGPWRDLQLPLYRALLRSVPGTVFGCSVEVRPSSLGYINLAPHAEKSEFAFLDCSDAEADDAERLAATIIARIKAGEFAPNPDHSPRADDPFAPIWGTGMRITAVRAEVEP